jgi:hypothetical protein
MKRRGTNWDDEDTFGSDILGTGAAWGEMRGKVKTKQIGFIRYETSTVKPKVLRKRNTQSRHKQDIKRDK